VDRGKTTPVALFAFPVTLHALFAMMAIKIENLKLIPEISTTDRPESHSPMKIRRCKRGPPMLTSTLTDHCNMARSRQLRDYVLVPGPFGLRWIEDLESNESIDTIKV
jgi:hypothetical protein